MSSYILHFVSLQELGSFLKAYEPPAYYANTTELTIKAELPKEKLEKALSEFQVEVQQSQNIKSR